MTGYKAIGALLLNVVLVVCLIGVIFIPVREAQLNNPRCPHCMEYVQAYDTTCPECRKDFDQPTTLKEKKREGIRR